MKLLVVLENHFYINNSNQVFCDRVVDYNFLRRYLDIFEKIIVCGRCQKLENNDDKKLLVSGKNVEFVPLPDFKGAVGLIKNICEIKKIIRRTVKYSDCVLYRVPTHLSLFTYKEVLKQKKILGIEFMMSADKMIEGNTIVHKLLNRFIVYKSKKMCMSANGVSYVTDNILQKEYPCQAIKNGDSELYFTESYSTIDLSEENFNNQNWDENHKPNTFKIIHTGYMDSYRKGQDVLIKATSKVIENGYNINLIFVGDGDKRKEFQNMVQDLGIQKYVKFLGIIKEKKKILDLLHESHLLVFPTESEGLPRTVIEAMSQGLPCISSPVDGIPELLDEDYLVDCKDINGYANKIMEILDDWEKMIRIGNDNYNKSKEYESSKLKIRRKKFYGKLYNLALKKYNKEKL